VTSTFLLLAVAAIAPSGAHGKQHLVKIDYTAGVCSVTFDGRRLPSDEHGYPDPTGIRPDGGDVRIIGSATVPYKCIGGVIYQLQVAGFRLLQFDAGQGDQRDSGNAE